MSTIVTVAVPVEVATGVPPLLPDPELADELDPLECPPLAACTRACSSVTSEPKPSVTMRSTAAVCDVAESLNRGLPVEPDQIAECFAMSFRIDCVAIAWVRHFTRFGTAPSSCATRSTTFHGPSTPYADWISRLLRIANDLLM